ncbi:MATE family efflux transporter [Romboutsia sedimentorum]|uniref:Multidrug export protein MepA n=1 Tax=Romboutsia sedimentorum TaxID=1368474 RepID=A0ABT7E6B7_9FIRM|nr:MATE family efflux transporter [Romboutsia sedimentorum]MDK2562473.1 MATE family efflux transporter [Romboutsia sedimentorum]MDK2584715.1 MATE family efflux transporter [Romboutsia sedimentorum]
MVNQFLKYAVPSALAMFISSLYTVIDGIFVGQGVGDSALAAINIVLPFTVVLFGIANMLAVGGGALVSKNVGAGDTDKAVNIFRQVFKLLLIVSAITSIVCIVFTEPIVKMLGATDNLKPLSVDYLRYYAIFCIPNLVGIVLNSFVRNDNKPKLAMVSTIAGAITNIALDYVFIFIFGLGIKGAAIATGLGQIVTVSILLPHFLRKKGNLSFGSVSLDMGTIKNFLSIGFPSFFAQASFSVIVLLHNIALVRYVGEIGISTYSIINYITTNIYMVLLGLTFGAQPLISYNFGKKDKQTMLKFYNITCKASLIVSISAALICFVFGKQVVGIFTNDPKIVELGYTGIKISCLAYIVGGINLNTLVYFQAIEIPKFSNLICFFRSMLFLPICLMVLPNLFGMNGIWFSVLTSESITFVVMALIANIKSYTDKSVDEQEKDTLQEVVNI